MDSAGDAGPTGDAELDALDALSDAGCTRCSRSSSEDQRAVLLLRIVADLPLEQVAATLGKRVGAVKALQHRALASLRRTLDARGGGRGERLPGHSPRIPARGRATIDDGWMARVTALSDHDIDELLAGRTPGGPAATSRHSPT